MLDLPMLDQASLSRLPPDRLSRLADVLRELDKRQRQRRFEMMFPDETATGPDGETYWARHLYPRHMEVIEATARYREVCMMAGNRVGKTRLGAYAATAWLTGRYPDWWTGHRFSGAIRMWAAGDSYETVRDILQAELFGGVSYNAETSRRTVDGTGMIPADAIGPITWRRGAPDVIDTARIRHVSGRWSLLGLKSYEQGRKSFQGTAQDVIWPDEEPPHDVYGEMMVRTATTNGKVLSTFTPLEGLSDVAMSFLEGTDNADDQGH